MVLLRQLLGLCLLRVGPEDLPADTRLLGGLLLAYLFSGGLMFMQEDGFVVGAAQAGMDAAMLAGFVWVALKLREHPARFIQTYAALLGISLVFTLLSWPIFNALPEEFGNEWSAAQIALLLALLWSLVAQGQVLRRALETSAGVGLLLIFVYFMLSSLMIAAIFSGSAPT
ncbi:MAG: hypothetical protein AB1717_09745 [Pseudomonadota bacterium]